MVIHAINRHCVNLATTSTRQPVYSNLSMAASIVTLMVTECMRVVVERWLGQFEFLNICWKQFLMLSL